MILIIGNSSHLFEAIRSAYPDDEIRVIPWRSNFHEITQIDGDLIFIVGFDYSSYNMPYDEYMNTNVIQPMFAVQRFSKLAADKVYITTQNNSKEYTFSRYRYAKEKLGQELVNQWNNSYVIRFDTFASPNHEPLVRGGFISKLIFSYLVKIGIVKIVDMRTVSNCLKNYQASSSKYLPNIKGFFISIPRPQFVDRLMRLFIA